MDLHVCGHAAPLVGFNRGLLHQDERDAATPIGLPTYLSDGVLPSCGIADRRGSQLLLVDQSDLYSSGLDRIGQGNSASFGNYRPNGCGFVGGVEVGCGWIHRGSGLGLLVPHLSGHSGSVGLGRQLCTMLCCVASQIKLQHAKIFHILMLPLRLASSYDEVTEVILFILDTPQLMPLRLDLFLFGADLKAPLAD